MPKQPLPFNRIIALLQKLHKDYPTQNIGRHLSLALADYGDLWGVPDKEICFALERYMIQLDTGITSDEDIARIMRDTAQIFSGDEVFLDSEEDEEDF
jgi:hypothetical protein